MRVHDGADADAPAVAALTGTELPAAIVSTSGSLYVEFTSDNAVAKSRVRGDVVRAVRAGLRRRPRARRRLRAVRRGTLPPPPGSAACVPCAAGEYAASTRAPACSPCPDYSRAPAGGAASVAECECLQGYAPGRSRGQRHERGHRRARALPRGRRVRRRRRRRAALPEGGASTAIRRSSRAARRPSSRAATARARRRRRRRRRGSPSAWCLKSSRCRCSRSCSPPVVLGRAAAVRPRLLLRRLAEACEKHAVDNMVSPLEEAMAALEVDAVPAEMSRRPEPHRPRAQLRGSPRSDARASRAAAPAGTSSSTTRGVAARRAGRPRVAEGSEDGRTH